MSTVASRRLVETRYVKVLLASFMKISGGMTEMDPQDPGCCSPHQQSMVKILHQVRSTFSEADVAHPDAMSRGGPLGTLTPSHRVFVHQNNKTQSVNLHPSRMNAGKSKQSRTSHLGEKPLAPAVEFPPCDDPKKDKKKNQPAASEDEETFEGVCGPRKFNADAKLGCHPSTKPFVRGMEPIKCFSVPIIAEHLRVRGVREPWYCKRPNLPKFDQGLAAKELARDARYKEKLRQLKAHERKMQVGLKTLYREKLKTRPI